MMRRRILSIFLLAILLAGVLPFNAYAAEPAQTEETVTYFEDGSYLVTTVSENGSRASGTKTGYKNKYYYNDSGELLWQATLSATFTYNGSSATCTAANCSVSINDSSWYVVTKSASRSGNTATAVLTMGKTAMGVTTTKSTYTITLSCDANGNLS